MSKPKRTWTAGFKRDAIALAKHGDRSVAQLERDLGLSVGCLRHWRADARRAAVPAPPLTIWPSTPIISI